MDKSGIKLCRFYVSTYIIRPKVSGNEKKENNINCKTSSFAHWGTLSVKNICIMENVY